MNAGSIALGIGATAAVGAATTAGFLTTRNWIGDDDARSTTGIFGWGAAMPATGLGLVLAAEKAVDLPPGRAWPLAAATVPFGFAMGALAASVLTRE